MSPSKDKGCRILRRKRRVEGKLKEVGDVVARKDRKEDTAAMKGLCRVDLKHIAHRPENQLKMS
jgi:hypothetical protein